MEVHFLSSGWACIFYSNFCFMFCNYREYQGNAHLKSKKQTKGSNADKNGQFPTLITLWPVRLLMLYVSSLLSTQTFLPEPAVFMINSFLLISRPSFYLCVPVMMLSYALAFPAFPHVFIDNATAPLALHYIKVKSSSLGLR